jgi:hypothetical protein
MKHLPDTEKSVKSSDGRRPAAASIIKSNFLGKSLSPPVQKKPNETGLPDQLKEGAESLSGISMDDVNVHYNSSKPSQLNAHAYAQGTDIHLGPGQEKHLPHEAWHVVQQKQGRVKPTMRLDSYQINDDKLLEKEADKMGSEISQMRFQSSPSTLSESAKTSGTLQRSAPPVVQRLSVRDTNWGSATEAKVTEGSGQGVAIISDGSIPVVVKGKQGWGYEVVVISELMNTVLQSNAGDEYLEEAEYANAITSRARLAAENELPTIQDIVRNYAGEVASDPDRKQNVINDIGTPPTVIYSYASGDDFVDVLAKYKSGDRKVTEKRGMRGIRTPRDGSNPIVQIWSDPGQMQQLGMASVVDIISGNGDRLLRYFNPKNFRLEEQSKTLVMIDNVAKAGEVFLGDNQEFGDTAEQSFNSWSEQLFIKPFILGNDAVIANIALQNFATNFEQNFRTEDQGYVKAAITHSLPEMKRWFRNGLSAGRANLKPAQNQLDQFVSGIPQEKREEFKINLLCRLLAVETQSNDYTYLQDISKIMLGLTNYNIPNPNE